MFPWLRLMVVIVFFIGMSALSVWPDQSTSNVHYAVSKPAPDSAQMPVDSEVSTETPLAKSTHSDDRPSASGQRLPPPDVEISGDAYATMQSRLQDLGVDYLLLERAPDNSPSYRFHCRIAVPGSSVYVRPFEAIDSDPLRAMQRVLADVEAWSAARATPGRVLR